jgi:hypothetical protein
MYQNVYHYDSHYHPSIIGRSDLMLYMMAARALAGEDMAKISGSHAYAF